jgi:hypothetical protein
MINKMLFLSLSLNCILFGALLFTLTAAPPNNEEIVHEGLGTCWNYVTGNPADILHDNEIMRGVVIALPSSDGVTFWFRMDEFNEIDEGSGNVRCTLQWQEGVLDE